MNQTNTEDTPSGEVMIQKRRTHPLPTWDLVCRPKDQGGLGIINLHTHNICLLHKMILKFINDMDLPWARLIWELYYPNGLSALQTSRCSFWWRDCLKFLPMYKDKASSLPQNGLTIEFWNDNWGSLPKAYDEAMYLGQGHGSVQDTLPKDIPKGTRSI